MAVDLIDRQRRVDVANEFIGVIAAHGRRFFHHKGETSKFELDRVGRVWFIDKYTKARIYSHKGGWWGPNFTEGGTLQILCLSLREYIMGRAELPLNQLGPWPKILCDGDLWGYGPDSVKVRLQCRALAERGSGSRWASGRLSSDE